jgi:hypothetical protein
MQRYYVQTWSIFAKHYGAGLKSFSDSAEEVFLRLMERKSFDSLLMSHIETAMASIASIATRKEVTEGWRRRMQKVMGTLHHLLDRLTKSVIEEASFYDPKWDHFHLGERGHGGVSSIATTAMTTSLCGYTCVFLGIAEKMLTYVGPCSTLFSRF